MKRILWWVCLLVAPAVLISIELFHPSGFTADPGMYQYLSHAEHHEAKFGALGYFGPGWWFAMHMIQTPTVGLVAVGLWLTVDGIGAADGIGAVVAAWLARAALFIFAIYFTVLDAIGGIGLGRTIVVVQTLAAGGKFDPQQMAGIELLLNTLWVDPVVGGVGSFVSETASWAALAASICIAAALLLSGRVPPDLAGFANMAVMLAFGWQLQIAHASPHGPIAFAFLIVAAVWMRLRRPRNGRRAKAV
jgi:hypothetical protein